MLTYKFSRPQKLYPTDFERVTARRPEPPYSITTHGNAYNSTPHNLLSGSAFAGSASKLWKSEANREFRDFTQAERYYGSGVRSEQTRFIG